MSQHDIQEIEVSIEEAKKTVERGERAMRLADNPDFKALILEGYFKDEAVRLVHLVSDPQMVKYREFINRDIDAIGGLKRYLSTLIQMGKVAESEISQAQVELDDIRAEEDGE